MTSRAIPTVQKQNNIQIRNRTELQVLKLPGMMSHWRNGKSFLGFNHCQFCVKSRYMCVV